MLPTARFLALCAVAVSACAPQPVSGLDSGVADAGVADAGPVDAGVPVDPTGFRLSGQLSTARDQATATLLADGRVLVVGGEDTAYQMISSVELFDPATDSFSAGPSMPEPRAYHSATRLNDGRVLIAGGGPGSQISIPNGATSLSSALLYDPATNALTATGSMLSARAGHRAALLSDGRVLVVGGGSTVGYSCSSIYPNCTVAASLATAEIYDPSSGQWSATGSLKQARIAFTLNAAPAGLIAAGGAAANQGLTSVEIYDEAAGTWHDGPALSGQRLYQSTTVLDGHLVVVGGKIANVAPISSVDVLDAAATGWSAGQSLTEARTGASFIALPSGRGLLVAGNDQLGTKPYIADAELYDVAADTWVQIGPLAQGRYSQSAVLLNDGTVLVLGGRGPTGVIAQAERSAAGAQ